MEKCIFCKIVEGDIPANKLYEDETCVAFYDQQPQAPIHFLVIPKEHIAATSQLQEYHRGLIGHIFLVITYICKQLELEDGYRIVNNCGENGGQTVEHLHFHVLAGRSLAWPPG